MIPDSQKNIKPESAEQPEAPFDLEQEKREIERLREELVERQRKLTEQGKGAETLTETEAIEKKAAEGQTSQETAESFSAPLPSAQIQQQAQQIRDLDKENQVRMLCNLAFEKGIDSAIKTAQNLDNAYILDEFHDTLLDQLYERLKGEGKIEEV